MNRNVYRRQDLARLFEPRSVAIVGASATAGSFGARVAQNLLGYDGTVYLVNARHDRIGERPCYRSMTSLPEAPDCVVMAVPRDAVEALVVECAGRGVGGVIIFASGYAETGKADRIAQQERLALIARESGMRIVGPNCIGIVNYRRGLAPSFLSVPESAPRPESIGIVSQSGALGFSLAQAGERGVSIGHVLTTGNSCDVDVADCVSYLAEDAGCRSIACLFEGVAAPERLIEAAEIAWAADKPLVVNKLATGEQGAVAAKSHTGTLAGAKAAYLAAFERTGAIVVENYEALIETAGFFAKAPAPKALGVAVIATSGGAAIMAADKAEIHGVSLPQPGEATRAVLESRVPDFGSARNPCDVTAQVMNDPQSLLACAEALMSDAAFGAMVVPHPFAYEFAVPRIRLFSELAARFGKPVCNVWVTEWLEGPGAREGELDPRIAMFRSMDRCFAALAAWQRRAVRRQSEPRRLARFASSDAAIGGARMLRDANHQVLTEREGKKLLSAYGIRVVEERLVSSPAEAVAAAVELGFPVVLKAESPDIPHKTEAGVIRVDLRTDVDVRAGFDAILANARAVPSARINGVLVQPMIPAGVEVMVGARIDPLFGPLVVVGLGGVLVELLKDTTVALAPVTIDEARTMLERLKGVAVLNGFRGSEPVDIIALAEAICRLSELASDQRDLIAEIDVNPLICNGARITAVDALIVRAS